jgi:hypothetical protein
MIKTKRKQQLVTMQEAITSKKDLAGSEAYLSDHKLDALDRELRKNIKEHDATKKVLILSAAEKYERLGYPTRLICKRISDLLSKAEYNTSAGYVRQCLPQKYKDLDQMNVAKKQIVREGVDRLRQQERVAKTDAKDITLEDF